MKASGATTESPRTRISEAAATSSIDGPAPPPVKGRSDARSRASASRPARPAEADSSAAAPAAMKADIGNSKAAAKPGAKGAAAKAAAADAPTPKANSDTMDVEKIPAEVQEPMALPAEPDVADAIDHAAVTAPPAAAPVVEEEEEEVDEAPVRTRQEMGRGSPMGHGRPQMSGPAPRIPSKAENFVEGDYVVYPTHGVGKVEKINVEDIAGHRLELIHITFEENRMTLRVPVAKARSAGLRKLATRQMFDEALAVLKGRARIKRTMWSRRAQEYEAKINSGDPLAIAEVVRDLHRNAGQPDQSFSERQIYEAAMDRLGAELAALDRTDKATAAAKLADFLKTI